MAPARAGDGRGPDARGTLRRKGLPTATARAGRRPVQGGRSGSSGWRCRERGPEGRPWLGPPRAGL